jgi:hypothetical protein
MLALTYVGSARADGQISSRLAVGAGAAHAAAGGTEALFELAVRTELLFGPATFGSFRIGPAIDLRTSDFVTAEAAGGLAVMFPLATANPLVLTAGAGWASRPGTADGPFALGTLAWGYRSYNHHAAYGYALQLYASGRLGLDDTSRWEITGGVEIDLVFLIAIPAIFLWELFTEGDPDEPED